MYQTTDFKKGLKIELESKLFMIVQCLFVNPGKGSAFYKTKLKNLETGAVIERTFKSGVDTGASAPDVEEKEMEYMYHDHEGYSFLDQQSYETIQLSEEQVGDAKNFLQEGIKIGVLYYKKNPIAVELPNFVQLRVTETDPGLKGDTASGGMKKAVLETGYQINVPLFIKQDELLKVDTRTGEYIERIKE